MQSIVRQPPRLHLRRLKNSICPRSLRAEAKKFYLASPPRRLSPAQYTLAGPNSAEAQNPRSRPDRRFRRNLHRPTPRPAIFPPTALRTITHLQPALKAAQRRSRWPRVRPQPQPRSLRVATATLPQPQSTRLLLLDPQPAPIPGPGRVRRLWFEAIPPLPLKTIRERAMRLLQASSVWRRLSQAVRSLT